MRWYRFVKLYKEIKAMIHLPIQGADGSEAILTVLQGRLTGTINYHSPNKLLIIEACGGGKSVK